MRKEEVEEKIIREGIAPINVSNNCSALFKLKMSDILQGYKKDVRAPHPLHSSDTGMNFSINKDGILANCWRHSVTLNAIQFLCVKNGYSSCQDGGVGHKNSGAGGSNIKGDLGAIFYAWIQAKKDGYIQISDPVPAKGLLYIAIKNKLINNNWAGKLPPRVYNKVLKIIEVEY